MPGTLKPDEILYCNCAHCGRMLVGETTAKHVNALYDVWPKDLAPPVFVRVGGRFGRPLCESCGKLVAKKVDPVTTRVPVQLHDHPKS